MNANTGHTPEAIAEAEAAAQAKRALHEGALQPHGAPVPGIGHNKGPPPLAVSIAEAAQALGIGRNSAYAAVAAGEIPVVRIGARLLVPVRALDAMIDGSVEAWRRRQQQA
jgi:excisionase family DNA binding protein